MFQNLLGLNELEKKQKKELEALKTELEEAIKKSGQEIAEVRKNLGSLEPKLAGSIGKLKDALEELRKIHAAQPAYATAKQFDGLKAAVDNIDSRITVLKNSAPPRQETRNDEILKSLDARLALLETQLKQSREEIEKLAGRAAALDSVNLLINRGYQEVAICPNCQNKGHPISFVGQICPTCRYSKLVKGLLVLGLQETKKKGGQS